MQSAAHRSSRKPQGGGAGAPHPESSAPASPLSTRLGSPERAAVGFVGALSWPWPRFAARKLLQRPGRGGCRRGWEGAGQAEQRRPRSRSSRIPAGTSEDPSSAFSPLHITERGNVHERRQTESSLVLPPPAGAMPCGQGQASRSRPGPREAHLRPAPHSHHSGCIPGEKL